MRSKQLIESWKKKKNLVPRESTEIVRRLKRQLGKTLDEAADDVHQQVFSRIDCLDCAGCCTGIPPIVNKTDLARIAKALRMKFSAFEANYLVVDEDGDTVMNTTPCPFLAHDNRCTIYDIRPKACRQYPHTDAQAFSRNIRLHARNASVCPAVHHILQELDRLFRPT
jgi:Fe-S-cluster containining protein